VPAAKPRPTLADYVTIVISPALVMAMIVSLVFFLVAGLYRGDYAARLHSILFFYIFGIVLVARIAMAGLTDRAPLYGGVLSVLTWIGMGNFVNYPPELAAASWVINTGLMALAWWLSHQLTHSCTHIDEKAESTGTGVLQAAGLERGPAIPLVAEGADPPPKIKRDKKRPPKATWWRRYQSFREERKRKQPPGVWVVYFALAALPIFGLGQALVDVTDAQRRTYGFWLMTVYVASSLGLLVTTAFLGLRRYLRQRRLEMPKTVTTAWLTLGGVLLVAFVVIGAALPRPQAEHSFVLARADSKELAASKFALTRGEPGTGKGRTGAEEHDPKGNATQQGHGRGGKGDKGQTNGKGRDSGGGDKNGKGTSKDSGTKAGNKGESDTQTKQDGGRQGESSGDEGTPQPLDNADGWSWFQSFQQMLTSLLKWIVFGVLILVTLFFVLNGGLRYLANFCDWARRLLEALQRFWDSLFGTPRRGGTRHDEATEDPQVTDAPFSVFVNPFHNGRADRMAPAEVVRYSFEALEAWARKQDHGRGTDETPIEFTNRLAEDVGALDEETRRLGALYASVLYAKGNLASDWRDTLEQFWERLAATPAARPTANVL
jgi:hypothetical protein